MKHYKKLILQALAIAVVVSCSSKNEISPKASFEKGKVTVTDLQIDNLRGRVKTIVNFESGETYGYNERGFKNSYTDNAGRVYNVQYNDQNFIVSEEYPDGSTSYEFDERNRRTKEHQTESHGNHTHSYVTTYTYTSDKKGVFETRDGYDITSSGEVELNDNMIIIKRVTNFLNRKGEVTSTGTKTYTESQILKTDKIVTFDGTVTEDYEDTYDENQQLLTNRKLLDDGSYATLSCVYDSNGHLQQRNEIFKGSSTTMEYTYEFDSKGNWTKRIVRVNPNLTSETRVETRALTYYE